jgi:AcrR family transcriptional regulator
MKKEKVDSILFTARHMFIRYGIQKTSLEEIARISRVAKATIYNYFGNKDQVFMEVLNREVADISARIHEAVEQVMSPMEKLRAFIFTTFGVLKESADILNLHTGLIERLMPKSRSIHRLLFSKQTATLQAILKEGVKKGIFKNDDLPTARSILYALRGIEITWLLNKDTAEIERDLEGLYKLICGGILREKESTCA